MKKAILIAGIITIVYSSLLALIFSIVGAINFAAYSLAAADSGAIDTPELIVVATVFIILGGYFLLGLIFSAILVSKRNSSMGKGAGIVLGIFGLLFGATVPGIMFIVDSATNRN